MLFFLHNRIFGIIAAGVCTFWLLNNKEFLFRRTTKTLLYVWMASFMFML